MTFIEVIFRRFLVRLIGLTGVFARWTFVAASQLLSSREVVSFRAYDRKMQRDKDPSNRMSDAIIHLLLGIGIWFGAIFLLV